MKKYVVIPACSDLNRGDQALVWETKRIAEDCGYVGNYYLTSERNDPVEQSKIHGINIISLILEHPSRLSKNKNNIKYNISLKIKWGMIAFLDFIISLLYLNIFTRKIVAKFSDQDKRKALKIMEEADAFFVKGGGLIHSYGGLTATYSIYFSLYHIILAIALKKPVYIMPNSFGPFEGPFVKTLIRKVLNKCTFISSRETYTQAMVKRDLGIEVENFPDLAFYLKNAELDKEELFEKYDIPRNKKLVALTVRPHRFPKSKTPEEDYLTFKKETAKFIKWLHGEGFMPVIIEHTLAINSHENDRACIEDVILMLKDKEYRLISDKSYNCYELKCIYRYCDYIVGTRFHSVIFSLANGVPGIAITYAGNKGQGIMHDIGFNNLSIPIEEVSCEILKDKFTYLLENEEAVKDKINKYNQLAKEQRKLLIKRIKVAEGQSLES